MSPKTYIVLIKNTDDASLSNWMIVEADNPQEAITEFFMILEAEEDIYNFDPLNSNLIVKENIGETFQFGYELVAR